MKNLSIASATYDGSIESWEQKSSWECQLNLKIKWKRERREHYDSSGQVEQLSAGGKCVNLVSLSVSKCKMKDEKILSHVLRSGKGRRGEVENFYFYFSDLTETIFEASLFTPRRS